MFSKLIEPHLSEILTLPAKSYLYHQGDLNQKSYILNKGWILLSRLSKDGTRQVLRSILPGDFLWLQPDLKGPHIYTAIAISDSVVSVVPDLVKLCSTDPKFALRFARISACELLLMETYLVNIAHRSSQERIAFMVMELYHRQKIRGLNRDYTIQFPLTQEDMADTLGLTTIHVNRTLKALKNDGLLKINKHILTILDYDALYAMVGSQLEPLVTCYFSKL